MELFSSWSASTQDVHFRWMREYGIDGVFMQRFVNGLEAGTKAFKDAVLCSALRAAVENGRVVSVMYDISGASEGAWAANVLGDWQYLVHKLNVTASPAWIHHNGKPVVSIWGIGFIHHPGTMASSLRLLQQLRAVTPITFVGGVPTHWREGAGDSKPGYAPVYEAMDVLSPWLVGRFSDDVGFDSNMKNIFVPDVQHTNARGQGYAPVVFPGFSWANLQRLRGSSAVFNAIPRHGGRFWTHQSEGFAAMSIQPLFIYGAMFDEADEGTAMFKAASALSDVPKAPAQFLYLSVDGVDVPADAYLSLAGNFSAKWRAQGAAAFRPVGMHSATWGDAERARRHELARAQAVEKLQTRKFLLRAVNAAAMQHGDVARGNSVIITEI